MKMKFDDVNLPDGIELRGPSDRAAFKAYLDEPGKWALIVEGAPGSGKSRLVRAIISELFMRVSDPKPVVACSMREGDLHNVIRDAVLREDLVLRLDDVRPPRGGIDSEALVSLCEADTYEVRKLRSTEILVWRSPALILSGVRVPVSVDLERRSLRVKLAS